MTFHKANSSETLAVGVGLSIEEVVERSSLPVRFEKSSEISYAEYHDEVLHNLRIIDGDLALVFPSMQSVAIQAIDGKISLFDDRPAKAGIALDEALDWVRKTTALIDKSGWVRNHDEYMTLYAGDLQKSYSAMSQLRRDFVDPASARKLKRARIATWHHDGSQMYLEILRRPYLTSPNVKMETDEVYYPTIGVTRLPRKQSN